MTRLLIAISFFIYLPALAQDYVTPLGCNPRLYYSTVKYQNKQPASRYKSFTIVENGNLLVESDTLALPFIDDFTNPTLKPYNYGSYIYDSLINVIGPCNTDTEWTVTSVTDSFSIAPTYTYTYDTTLHKIDTIPNAKIIFYNALGVGVNCYDLGDTAYLYPRSYIYIFDTITGAIKSKVFDPANTPVPLTYLPVLYKSKAPLYTKWLDNNAYQNFTNAYLPPTIGVATFDGLNSFGQPYNKSNPSNWGIADYLTSKPINLDGLTFADSVYLSFFYQPGGFGDVPTVGDSLVLQFYNGNTNQWDHIWSVTGDSVIPTTPDSFKQIMIRLDSTSNSPPIKYFFNGFQFRFVNYGSLTGNNDIWNIDYVRLNKNRTFTDTSINDLAFQYEYPAILKNYTEMPAEQFTGAADLADTVSFFVANLNPTQATNNPPATPLTSIANVTFPTPSVVMAAQTNTFNAGLENTILLYPNTQYTPPIVGQDTMVIINSQSALNNLDILPANDTITHNQVLYNTLAYDDGTAELAYGVQNLGLNKFAYDFTLNKPDTLIGYQVLFSNIDVNVSDLVFNFNLWYNLDTQNVFYTDTPVYTSNNNTPYYIDSVNGFTTYRIAPVPLPLHFYFGWSQFDVRNLQIGYDVNSTKGRPHMYIYTSGVWQQSSIYTNGSPMIRLILGHTYQIASGVKEITSGIIKAYPNPTNCILTFDLPDVNDTYTVQIYNLLGQLSTNQTITATANTINTANLEQGVYLLRITDIRTGIEYQNKIIKAAKE